jgi:hypothetical protein
MDEGLQSIDRNFPSMQLSMHYCYPVERARTLALYGLLAAVEESLYRASDPVVSRAKLGWWLDELQNGDGAQGAHPLIGQLHNSGALSIWPKALIGRLFALAMNRIDASGFNNEEDLKELCVSIGLIQLELETGLHGLPMPDHALVQHWAAINGLIQLLRTSINSKDPSFYWVPLTFCAEFGIERQQLSNRLSTDLSGRLIASVIELVWNGHRSTSSQSDLLHALPTSWTSENRHWMVLSGLQQRELGRIKHQLVRSGLILKNVEVAQRLGIGDGWFAWRWARQLEQAKRS